MKYALIGYTIGSVTGRALGLPKIECLNYGGGDLAEVLHVFQFHLAPLLPPSSLAV